MIEPSSGTRPTRHWKYARSELDTGQHARRVAGQSGAIGSDRQKDRAETVHARFRPALEVVGHHEENAHALAGFSRNAA